jgi:hypothetical protein
MRKEAEILDECQKSILEIYTEHAKEGVTAEQLDELINAETWLTGKQAAELFNIEIEGEIKEPEPIDSTFKDRYNRIPNNIFKNSDILSDNTEKERLMLELEVLSL